MTEEKKDQQHQGEKRYHPEAEKFRHSIERHQFPGLEKPCVDLTEAIRPVVQPILDEQGTVEAKMKWSKELAVHMDEMNFPEGLATSGTPVEVNNSDMANELSKHMDEVMLKHSESVTTTDDDCTFTPIELERIDPKKFTVADNEGLLIVRVNGKSYMYMIAFMGEQDPKFIRQSLERGVNALMDKFNQTNS